jgi:hypothetical protein
MDRGVAGRCLSRCPANRTASRSTARGHSLPRIPQRYAADSWLPQCTDLGPIRARTTPCPVGPAGVAFPGGSARAGRAYDR